jgi:aspartokinase-like uncharacterized kinase
LTVEIVVKLGGGLLAHEDSFRTALGAISEVARSRRVLIVPGGGPFSDAVREVDRRVGLSDDAAHWMAVLAMDQYAHVIAQYLDGAVLVDDRTGIARALDAARIPVLVSTPWLQRADPLPHSWSVTADSIAAWVAGEVGAPELVLVKPPGAKAESGTVDEYFDRALPAGIRSITVPADRLDELRTALGVH